MRSLHEKTAIGIIWTSIESIGAGATNLIVTMILARLLTPADFGTIELVMIFSSISEIFVDSGFSQSLIREHEVTDLDFSTVFWINLVIAILLYIVLFASSGYIASYFNIAILKDLCKFVFLTIIINSLTLVQNARLTKELRFNLLAKINVISIIISGFISILLASLGFGIWALAANSFFISLFRAIFLWIMSKWMPLTRFSFPSAKKHFKFGGNLMLYYLIDKITTNLESFVIGRMYTKSELGYFSQARKLDSYLIQTGTKVVQKVTYPVLSTINNEFERLKSGYREILKSTMLFVVPIVAFSVANSEILILAIFGPKWLQSAQYFRIWSIIGCLVAMYSVFTNIFMVSGKSRKLLIVSSIRQTLRIVSMIILFRKGIFSLLLGILITTIISTILYISQASKIIGLTFAEIFTDLWKIIISAIVSAVVSSCIAIVLKGLSIWPIFLIEILVMILSFLFMLRILKEDAMSSLVNLAKRVIRKK